jgi:predicted DNA-binding protein with PD1-like motif
MHDPVGSIRHVGSLGSGTCARFPWFLPQRTFDAISASARRQRTADLAVILETGEEVLSCLQRFVSREHVLAAQITAIGALSDVVLMYFDWDKKDYLKIPVREQVEVASLIGDVAEAPSGEPALHLHLVVGKRDGSAMAGHLGEAHVRSTLEVIVTESPAHLRKIKDPESGLALIRPAA